MSWESRTGSPLGATVLLSRQSLPAFKRRCRVVLNHGQLSSHDDDDDDDGLGDDDHDDSLSREAGRPWLQTCPHARPPLREQPQEFWRRYIGVVPANAV